MNEANPMNMSQCKTIRELYANLPDSVIDPDDWVYMALQYAYELGQQSTALPCYTVGNAATDKAERRSKPRGVPIEDILDGEAALAAMKASDGLPTVSLEELEARLGLNKKLQEIAD